jgi:predicted O-methyltransferase YrrM
MAVKGSSTALSEELFGYLVDHFAVDDPLMHELKTEATKEGIPEIYISEEQAAFMQVFLKSIGAKHVLEVGTLGGYSAINMARALPEDGYVVTIEINAKHAAFAQKFVDKAGLHAKVRILTGAALDVLPTLAGQHFDFAFLDADKSNYHHYLEHCLKLVKHRGVIAADNAFAFGQLFEKNLTDKEAPAMIAFNEQVAKDKRLQSMIVPVGDGLMLSYIK